MIRKVDHDSLAASSKVLSLDEACRYIHALDFSYLVEIMCAPAYPLPRWTKVEAQHCCQLYKNFLILFKKYPGTQLVPTREIDEFWHNHILHTKRYVQDCLDIFGYYLHHEPASPTDQPDQLIHHFLITKQLYLETFGQPLVLERSEKSVSSTQAQ
jgi:hypothetical protein